MFRAFREFSQLEASGGIVLIGATILALAWANSPWADSYFKLWNTTLTIQIGEAALSHDLHWWINEALMVLFFFVIGLEIKREVLAGELSSLKQAALPISAAIGGMLVPAALYAWINGGTPGVRGWGVPMATDIAFALGVMALLGPRAPLALKVFLTALAIVDDIGGILVIAIFYTSEIAWVFVAIAAGILFVLALANRLGVRSPLVYGILGIGLWLAFLESGIHATLAGVLLALTIPARGNIQREEFIHRSVSSLREIEKDDPEDQSLLPGSQLKAVTSIKNATKEVQPPLQRMEHGLHPWVSYVIIPLFALANAGLSIRGDFLSILAERVSLGIIIGLIAGKQVGISLASWLAVKLKLAELPNGVTWKQIYATGWLAGIGFTMSLFISGLAFNDEASLEAAKLGILAASLIAGLVGYTLLRVVVPEKRLAPEEKAEALPTE